MFNDGVIYAPVRKWSNMVIDEIASFPRAPHDDLTDCSSQALNWLRNQGFAQLAKEARDEENYERTFRGKQETVQQRYGI